MDQSNFNANGITRNILTWMEILEQNLIFQMVQYKIGISYVPHGYQFDPIYDISSDGIGIKNTLIHFKLIEISSCQDR